MKILCFDTATPVTSVAVGVDGRVASELSITGDKTQMERLMPMIDSALKKAGLSIRDIDGIAVGSGPGLFTALRIGVVTANALSQVLSVPVVGISSLDTLAKGCEGMNSTVAAVIDAKRGEVFAGIYQKEGQGAAVEYTKAESPDELAERLAGFGTPMLVGNGVAAYLDVFKKAFGERLTVAPPEFMYPRGASQLALAALEIAEAEAGVPGQVKPIYVRNPDADRQIKRMKT